MLENEIKDMIVELLMVDRDKITLDSHFVEDLGADSLDVVEMIMQLEEKYNVPINDEDGEKLTRVRDVINYIKANSPEYK